MKKFLALVLAVLMIAGSVVTASAFTDVEASSKYAKAINELQTQNVVAGVTETTFNPDGLVTRWQMALFMARSASGITNDAEWAEGAKLFTDCTNSLGAIQYCYSMGIIKGVTATEFAPDANITLRDGVIMAVRALGYEKEDEHKEAKKYNVTGANYWTPYYQKAMELGLLENLTTVAVDKALTRAETAQLIYNMLYTEVYANDGTTSNVNKYTLNDIAFGGKKIYNVETVYDKAYVSATPGRNMAGSNTIDEDEEIVEITYYDDLEDDYKVFYVTFEDLAKYGVDTKNIEDYYLANVKIVNYKEGGEGVRDYEDFEALEFDNENRAELTYDNLEINEKNNRIKIGTKTHYFENADTTSVSASRVIDLVKVDVNTNGEAITLSIDPNGNAAEQGRFQDLLDKYYDVTVYDLDNNGYYDYGEVRFYNVAQYKEASAKGVEKCGIMSGVEDVVYSKSLDADDVFVYTYDAFSKKVDVKDVFLAGEGKVESYKNLTNDDGDVYGNVKIGGKVYEIAATDAEDLFDDVSVSSTVFSFGTSAGLRAASKANIGDTYEFFTYKDKLIAYGDEVEEEENNDYLVIKDFTDYELYDHVVLLAVIDGTEKEIKVNKIVKYVGTKKTTQDLSTYSYSKLAKVLDNVSGLYKYEADDDGYYTLTAVDSFATPINELIKSTTALTFYRGNTSQNKLAISADKALRISTSTKIYLVTEDEDGILDLEVIPAKTSGSFTIPVNANTTVYADKIGYGEKDTNGVASIIYIYRPYDGNDADIIDPANYRVVFVSDVVEAYDVASASEYGIDSDDSDDLYTCYNFEGDYDDYAFVLSTFAGVDNIYKAGNNGALSAGVYVVDNEGKILGGKSVADIVAAADNSVIEITLSNGIKIGLAKLVVTASDISLGTYPDKRIRTAGNILGLNGENSFNAYGANIQTIKFRFFEVEAAELAGYTDRTNDKLVTYLKGDDKDDAADDIDATILVLGNDFTDENNAGDYFPNYTAYPSNTFAAVVIGEN